jgi:hypothetical protein
MKNASWRLSLARLAGIAAILSLPAFVWLGWWHLSVSLLLAIAAAALTPGPPTRGENRWRQQFHALQRRLHPHSWRPGRW